MKDFRVSCWQMVMVAIFIGIGATLGATLDAASADGNEGGQPNDKRPVYLDRSAHPTAADSCTPLFIWQGAGNPNTTFQRKRNLDAGVELAIKGIIRQGPDIRSTYVDGNGLVHIEVPAGAQTGNPSRAAWNFTYSYDVALDPSNTSLEEFEGHLWIDLDPSEGTRYLRLTLDRSGIVTPPGLCPREPDLNGYQWKSGNSVVIPDDEGTDQVTQNSQNYAFYRTLIDSDRNTPGVQPYTFGPAQFDVVMALRERGDNRGEHDGDEDDYDDGDDHDRRNWTILHVVFDVVTVPSQTP